MNTTRLVLAGGRGFLGQVLSRYFADRGREIVVLTRTPKYAANGVREVRWDGKTVGDWVRVVDGADALINLAGVSVNCRYHARNRRLILDSRVNSTRALGQAIARCAKPPRAWLNSSTATIYKHTVGPAWDESGEIGGCAEANDIFSVQVATEWERVFFADRVAFSAGQASRLFPILEIRDWRDACPARKVALRSALVLGTGANSVFPTLRRLVRFGLGGKMGSGRQFVSWIHEADFCRAIDWLLQREDFNGVVNLAAPNPVTNAEMMSTLREVCHRPFGLPATRWMLEIGAFFLRTETELIIKSRRVVPKRLLASGFQFQFPELRGAMRELDGQTGRTSA